MEDSKVTCTDYTDTATCSTNSGNISALHLLITTVILFITSFVFYLIVTVRHRNRVRYLRSLPRTSTNEVLPVGKDSRAGASVPNRVHQAMMHEFNRNAMVLEVLAPDPKAHSDASWGKWGSQEWGTHFETTIAKSYMMLEEAALKFDPKLRIEPRQTVRQYVNMLKRECSEIDTELCDSYVVFYEKARFGNTTIENAHYQNFMKSFYKLVQFFETKPHVKQRRNAVQNRPGHFHSTSIGSPLVLPLEESRGRRASTDDTSMTTVEQATKLLHTGIKGKRASTPFWA